MKKKIILLCSLATFGFSFAQVGVNTTNPQGAFHVDGAKDNNITGTPTAAQQLNDFVVTSTGNVGVGTTAPNAKMEINSGTANTSGLRFTNLTSTTPISSGQTIGVDASGNVVTLPNPTAVGVTTAEVASSSGADFNVNDSSDTVVSGSVQNITIPTGGKAVFINFMLGIDFVEPIAGTGAGYFRAMLFIDGVATNTYLITQEPLSTANPNTGGQQLQYTLSTVKELAAGNHTLDVRMRRTAGNGTLAGAVNVCRPISMSFNASYLN
ncbi:hypothetical protein SAMN05443633_101262 [Chryseobacterium arachidis]|uniref:C1q domain-containing protein n=1 Tax=Chryseobacterium arachidis TaxID=1416778 RepID=A0A1M4TKV2_9FLAO|nr:hypothetical protein [Chryseobacterium arachidis]SHE45058.1 hypothetical protein SAMN05443633_101262 [Chryseobacterium arachidis]